MPLSPPPSHAAKSLASTSNSARSDWSSPSSSTKYTNSASAVGSVSPLGVSMSTANDNNLVAVKPRPFSFSEDTENVEVVQGKSCCQRPQQFVSAMDGACSSVFDYNSRPNETPLPHTDWQSGTKTLQDRSRHMFNNELMADVYFIVGGSPIVPDYRIESQRDSRHGNTSDSKQGQVGNSTSSSCSSATSYNSLMAGSSVSPLRIPAHKYVLATGSSVFYAMLYGPLAESCNKTGDSLEITIPDIEPVPFMQLLRYLYYDDLSLDIDVVLPTLYAAKKYIIPHLAQACVDFLLRNLSASNVCILLCNSRLFDETELTQRCWELLDPQAKESLQAESFVEIDHKTLSSILGRDTLMCSEIDLYRAAQRWSRVECDRQGLEASAENQRAVLGDLIYLIRVPTMKLDEFANHVAQSGLLDLKLVTETFLHFTAVEKPCLPFPVNPRQGLSPKHCQRFHSAAQRSNQWRYRGRCDSIQFQTNQRIFVAGYGLYGATAKGTSEYSVKMEIKDEKGVSLARHSTSYKSDGTDTIFPVMFEHPIKVEGEQWYTASVLIDGRELSWFGQEGLTEVAVGCLTFKFQSSSESTNGTGIQGGQIPDIIFYG